MTVYWKCANFFAIYIECARAFGIKPLLGINSFNKETIFDIPYGRIIFTPGSALARQSPGHGLQNIRMHEKDRANAASDDATTTNKAANDGLPCRAAGAAENRP